MTITMTTALERVASGFIFTEDPRWRAGRLYFSDTLAGKVHAVDEAGALATIATLDDHCSGLGFMPNGDLLIVSAGKRRLMRLGREGLRVHADLAEATPLMLNDMAVDAAGRAYVVDLPYDPTRPMEAMAGAMWIVEPDGRVRCGANDLFMGNGTVISADGRTLITAETMRARLLRFDIAENGDLKNRRVFAQLPPGHGPDGISLDAEGAIWAALPGAGCIARVEDGGRITHKIPMPDGRHAYACMLGGPDRRWLYICTGETHDGTIARAKMSSAIDRVKVAVAGAGLP